ncbi:MAG TPA: DoxX family protein [Kineosporiaceae bacterium]
MKRSLTILDATVDHEFARTGGTMFDALRDYIRAFFRIAVGFLFACHGAASLFGVLGGAAEGGGAVPVGTWPVWYAALIQLVTGILVAFGLLVVPASLLASGSMAYAYFVVHQKDGLLPILNQGEPAAMFSLAFLLIATLGTSPYSVDYVIASRRTPRNADMTR